MATAGEYEIHHELGRGGMGSVFLAREIGLDRLVAIKVLPPSLMFDEGLIERFKREARMVAKLHHPNIIPVYRVHHSHNLAFYTMHFVPGRSLNELMGPNRVPSLQEVERVMLESAAGLGYAHKRGVIHRDVKPANILVDAEGHVHLTDFGIAKALVGNTQLTETGALIGTPQYMAPEQCEGRMVDGRADQYSLAAVGYQLLTGNPPFQSDSMKELLYHHLFSPPRPLNAVRPDTPLSLRDAIHKALSKDPTERFDSMEDFRVAVEGKGPPVFVSWLDQPERSGAPAGPPSFRRSSDPPTTKRFAEVPWAANGQTEDMPAIHGSAYRRVMGALAATVLTVAAVGVLAVSKGPGLVSSTKESANPKQLSLAGPEMRRAAPEAAASDANTPSAADESNLAEAVGRLSLAASLPAGASLEIDGRPVDLPADAQDEIELSPGTHQLVITAAGYSVFQRDVQIEAGKSWVLAPELERLVSQPKRQVDRRPAVPGFLLDELNHLLVEGNKLHEFGRYVEATHSYRDAYEKAGAGLGTYRDDRVLQTIVAQADEGIRKARLACRMEQQTVCP